MEKTLKTPKEKENIININKSIEKEENIGKEIDTNLNQNSSNIISSTKLNNKDKKNDYKKKKRFSQDNLAFLNRFINYEKKKEEKISGLKKEKDEKEKNNLRKRPFLSRKSVELISRINLKDNFLERMEEEEKKSKIQKEKLVEKIKNERAKKKEEIEKPLDFKIKPTIVDKKFNKIYQEMLKKEEFAKEKLEAFKDVVNQYNMRECVFQPNINKEEDNNNDNIKRKKIRSTSSEVIQRLYNDELKNKEKKRENLEKKYKLSFKPKIGDKSIELALKRKKGNNKEKALLTNTIEKKEGDMKKLKKNSKKINEKDKIRKSKISKENNKALLKINIKEENKENTQNNK